MNLQKMPQLQKVVTAFFYLFFWLWNLSTLAIAYIGILPFVGIWLIRDTLAGQIPFDFFFTLWLLILVPTVGFIVGIVKFRDQPFQLMRLFYGIEAPLFLLALLRLFLIRELTVSSAFLLLSFFLVIAAFIYELSGGTLRKQGSSEWLHLLTHSVMVLVGSYVGALLAFYAFPAAFKFLQGFFSFDWVGGLFEMFMGVFRHGEISILFWGMIGMTFFLLTAIAFILLPIGFAAIHISCGLRYWKYFASRYGKNMSAIAVVLICAAWIFLGSMLQTQPQIDAFGLLANEAPNDDARRELLKQENVIRKGLVNAYLHAYRYLSTYEENTHIREIYHGIFGLDRDITRVFQDAYNVLLSPLLYNGFSTDDEKAAELYGTFFDTPIQKGERRVIEHALQSTYNRDEAKAGLLNINQEKVWLVSQQVTVEPHDEWASVELYEVYENKTYEEQEVFYSFSLPESAAITGLWLGHSADLTQRFEFQVSPRGAAQQVYNNQVQRRRDPALLEQVGPRHYRLRAFPIPQRMRLERGDKDEQPRFHLWLSYVVLRQKNSWPLPHLGERRNVFWNKKTQVNYNGYTRKHPGDEWLPESLTANTAAGIAPRSIEFPGGYALTVKPLSPTDIVLPQGKRFAVLLDGSYSMKAHRKEIQTEIDWLQNTLATDNHLDLYLTDANPEWARRMDDLRTWDAKKLLFFGTIQFKDILRQLEELRGSTAYDALLLVTDEGSYELADNEAKLPLMPAPLWMVHVNGLAKAYDDATLQAIQQSGGGVANSVQEVVQRLAATAVLGDDVLSVSDGYAWFLQTQVNAGKDGSNSTVSKETMDGFRALAARQLILGLSRRLDMSVLENLDLIHSLSKTYRVVSPYSSMIVLVNERQQQELKEAEAQTDRFDREVESGHEVLEEPDNPLKSAGASTNIPEPGTMMLMGFGLVVLGWLEFRRRRRRGRL